MNYTITANMSKKDEIGLLIKLHTYTQAHAGQTYLASLFTPALIEWVAFQINSDLAPDVMDALQHAESAGRESYTKERDARLEVEHKLVHAQAEIERLTTRLENADARVKEWCEASQAYRELADDRLQAMNELSDTVNTLSQRITELKAHLYDLEHA